MDAVLEAAAKSGVAPEINASPWRLDLEDIYARRAWLTARNVINTWPTEEPLAWLRSRGKPG